MSDIARIFAENLRGRRRELGLTQRELGERLGYSEKAISKWEGGSSMPPAVMLPALASELRVTLDDLLSEQGEVAYYLGIDGGGTKTEFLLSDSRGGILRRVLLGCCNPNDIGIEAALDVLRVGIAEAIGELSPRRISVFAGIAGSTTGEHRSRIMALLERLHFAVFACDSDARNAVSAALHNEDGIAIILGTGSIAFVQCNGERRRVGGHGYLLGDGGSGFAFGRDGIDAALTDEEGCEPKTVLRSKVQERLGGENIWDSVSVLYQGGKRMIATFAPLVFEAASEGDAVSLEILRKNMRDVARLIQGAATHLHDQQPYRVVLCGGLMSQSKLLLPILQETFGESLLNYDLQLCEKSMAEGALLLAQSIEKGRDKNVKD